MSSDILAELERLDADRPTPPPLLYKYVIPARTDVLEKARIRFTPPLNTNDIFEVRQSFDLIVGPKMEEAFKELSKDLSFDEELERALQDSPLNFLSNENAKALYALQTGENFDSDMRNMFGTFLSALPSLMNSPEQIDQLLDKIASGQLLLSLTETPRSSPMWAHYADNSRGFVIAFDTTSEFFRRGDSQERQALHKIKYFDGRVGEIFDDPYASLVSKQADWSYEREWRLYAKGEDVNATLTGGEEDIHLIEFPREVVQRVVLGTRSPKNLEDKLRDILALSYPRVSLMRARADRTTASLTEVPA
jgi:hypothetical protein